MEEIDTRADRMSAKFNESFTHSAPKKLKFSSTDSLLNVTDLGLKNSEPIELKKSNVTASGTKLNLSGMSIDNSMLSTLKGESNRSSSNWEIRRLKADLIEAKTRICNLRQEVERRNKLHTETETLMENRVTELKKQCNYSAEKVEDMEKNMQTLRKREYSSKQEILKLQAQLQEQKHEYEGKLLKMKNTIQETEDNARLIQNDMRNEIGEYKRHTEQTELEIDMISNELKLTQEQLYTSKSKANAFDEMKNKYDTLELQLSEAQSRIKSLEFNISTYNDWKDITNICQERLLSMPELMRELERLRAANKNLQNLIGNKLVLEEEVHDLRKRLIHDEELQTKLLTTQMELKHTKDELNEWIAVGKDYCNAPMSASSVSITSTTENSSCMMRVSPLSLRNRIEELLKEDIIQKTESSNRLIENKALENELKDCREKCQIHQKNLEDMKAALIRYKSFKERFQKKIMVISKERDCYKQLLESFEKDLSISNNVNSIEQGTTEVNHLKYRLEMLEKTLTGYKEMCASLEKELNVQKSSNATGSTNSTVNGSEQQQQSISTILHMDSTTAGCYDHLKHELDSFRIENQRLRRRKEELEMELLHTRLKDNIRNYTNQQQPENDDNDTQMEEMVSNLKSEVVRLKGIIGQLETEREEIIQNHEQEFVTLSDDDDGEGDAESSPATQQLRQTIKLLNMKIKRLRDSYRLASLEFRDVVYMLFGYYIDRVGVNATYKLVSMYAGQPDEYLNFRMIDENSLDILETNYSLTLKPLIDTHIGRYKSVPSFLSALTLQLFQKATITVS